jgi:hypothetical protein
MLRLALLGFAIILTLVGIGCALAGAPGAFPLTFWGLVLMAAVLLERWRYARTAKADERPWQETGERFVDPESGRLMSVQYSPGSGERRYVPIDEDGSLGA